MIVPILVAAVAIRSVRGAAYVGCIDPASIPSGTTTTGSDLDTCINSCTSSYAFYDNGSGTCTCASSGGSNSAYEEAQNSGGTCSSDQASAWLLNTAFGFNICAETTTTNGRTRTNFPASADACFTACADYPYAAWTRYDAAYLCICADEMTPETPENCQGGAASSGLYAFQQSVVVPTGNARRQLRERLRRAQVTQYQYCPSGLTGCIVGSDSEAFECIDTKADLESCGGCMNGLYGPTVRNSTSVGVDCSALPNVALGGVTCTRGRCEVSACKYGYALVDNQCVRML
ncbi:hypothetical protein V866_005496 [Kwoniella sp. B9012]